MQKLDETLSQIPGVFLQNQENVAQGERVAIRRFGSRAPFGVRGVTVVVDGIPYTLPDGQAQLDAIDLDSAERIEVIRGSADLSYRYTHLAWAGLTQTPNRKNPSTMSWGCAGR